MVGLYDIGGEVRLILNSSSQLVDANIIDLPLLLSASEVLGIVTFGCKGIVGVFATEQVSAVYTMDCPISNIKILEVDQKKVHILGGR